MVMPNDIHICETRFWKTIKAICVNVLFPEGFLGFQCFSSSLKTKGNVSGISHCPRSFKERFLESFMFPEDLTNSFWSFLSFQKTITKKKLFPTLAIKRHFSEFVSQHCTVAQSLHLNDILFLLKWHWQPHDELLQEHTQTHIYQSLFDYLCFCNHFTTTTKVIRKWIQMRVSRVPDSSLGQAKKTKNYRYYQLNYRSAKIMISNQSQRHRSVFVVWDCEHLLSFVRRDGREEVVDHHQFYYTRLFFFISSLVPI